jgi:dTDP-4-amino-4,6-dideoxygalactose transaminase
MDPKKKYVHQIKGFNSKLDSLQAAILRVKLNHLDQWNERRRVVATKYLKELSKITGLILPFVPEWAEPVWHIFATKHSHRNILRKYLKQNGIKTLIHYPIPPHLPRAYSKHYSAYRNLPVTEGVANSEVSLPISPHLKVADQEYIIKSCFQFHYD